MDPYEKHMAEVEAEKAAYAEKFKVETKVNVQKLPRNRKMKKFKK